MFFFIDFKTYTTHYFAVHTHVQFGVKYFRGLYGVCSNCKLQNATNCFAANYVHKCVWQRAAVCVCLSFDVCALFIKIYFVEHLLFGAARLLHSPCR